MKIVYTVSEVDWDFYIPIIAYLNEKQAQDELDRLKLAYPDRQFSMDEYDLYE